MLQIGGAFVLKIPTFRDPQTGSPISPTFGAITIRRNGATDTAIAGSITTVDATNGAYEVTSASAVPNAWSAGDNISALVLATYNSQTWGVWTNSEVVDATVASRYAAGAAVASVTGSVGSVTGSVGSVTGGVGGTLADARIAHLDVDVSNGNYAIVANLLTDRFDSYIGSHGAQLTAVAGIVWNALTSTMSTAGSLGKKLKDWTLGSDNKALLSADTAAGSALEDLLKADRYIDKTTNPTAWALVLIKKGTGALGAGGAVELLRQPLYDVDGNALHSTTTVIGRSVAP